MDIKPFKEKIWLSTPTMHGEELQYVKDAFDTNWVSTVGENLNQFEKGICEYVGCKYAVALASGTSAIHMALKMADVKPGDKVFCSDLTFSATANPITYENATPVFIDSEYDTWNMDPKALRKAFEVYPDTKVVVVVHLYGTPAKIDEISEICNENNAVLIEDAAESLGALYKGSQLGTFGKYSAISFNGNKIITTSGGGMFLTDDYKAAQQVRKLSTQAREKAAWYQHEHIGYNYRMSNIVAGIGRGQLLHLDEHITRKREIYERYKDGLKDLPISMNPYIEADMKPNFWLSCMLIDKDAMCFQHRTANKASYVTQKGKTCPTEILEELARYNIEGRPIWKPMHMQPIFLKHDFISSEESMNVSEDIFKRGICLPSDIAMTGQEQSTIIELIKRCFK